MSFVKKRSADALLKAAKKMIKEQNEDRTDGGDQHSPTDVNNGTQANQTTQQSAGCDIRIIENKRNHQIPDYTKLSPSEFMSWWITSTGAKVKASNVLLKYMKFKFDLDIATDYRTLLRTPVTLVPKYRTLGAYVHLGVRPALKHLMTEAGPITSLKVFMQFFVDGLKISKSTKDEVWIIMMNVRRVTKRRLTPKVDDVISVVVHWLKNVFYSYIGDWSVL